MNRHDEAIARRQAPAAAIRRRRGHWRFQPMELRCLPRSVPAARPPGPEPDDRRHLLDYRLNIFAGKFILNTKSTFVGGQLGGLIFGFDVPPESRDPRGLSI